MPTVQIGEFALEEAEVAIARVWLLVEADDLSSPQLLVQHRKNGHAKISLRFERQEDADILEAALQGSPLVRGLDTEPA
jgi:hypothetical protein